jgi:hypothetical protein
MGDIVSADRDYSMSSEGTLPSFYGVVASRRHDGVGGTMAENTVDTRADDPIDPMDDVTPPEGEREIADDTGAENAENAENAEDQEELARL